MRLFISCFIPEKISTYLRELSLLLPEGSLTIPKQFDLTMRFIGEVPESHVAEIENLLKTVQAPSFEASLEKIGFFSEKRLQTIWVGVSPKESFFTLHHAVEKALQPLFPPDPRFFPHITLARVKSVPHKGKFLEKLMRLEVLPLTFAVDTLVLVQSKTTHEGAIHTTLFEQKLS